MADGSNFDDVGSIVRLSGVNVPARARFVGEAMVSATMSSLALGLCGGVAGAATLSCGPLMPFLVGSWTGYTFGLVYFYRMCERTALHYAQRYPTILSHALLSEHRIVVPKSVLRESERRLSDEHDTDSDTGKVDCDTVRQEGPSATERYATSTHGWTMRPIRYRSTSKGTVRSFEEWILDGGLGRMAYAILAAQGCRSDVEEIQRQQMQKLMEEYQEKHR